MTITILNYSNSSVNFIFIKDSKSILNIEEFIVNQGYKLSEISYMISDEVTITHKLI